MIREWPGQMGSCRSSSPHHSVATEEQSWGAGCVETTAASLSLGGRKHDPDLWKGSETRGLMGSTENRKEKVAARLVACQDFRSVLPVLCQLTNWN